MDTFTDVTSESWFSRIGNSFKQVIFGVILILVSAVLLWWNEGRAVTTARSLAEGKGAVVEASSDKVDTALDGKLVHVTGQATGKGTLSDPDYGVTSPESSLRLERKVEMFQWTESKKSETRTKIGGGTEKKTTYSYATEWSSTLEKSSDFKQPQGHENPTSMPASRDFVSPSATLGAYTLSDSLVKRIDTFAPLTPDAKSVAASPQGAQMRVAGEQLYRGADPSQPKVGDIRITFRTVAPTLVSVIAGQAAGGFQPFQIQGGDALEMLDVGSVSAAQMFTEAESANTTLTWILRAVGWLLMTVGIGSLFSPFTTFASVLPFLGDILGFGVGLFSMVIGTAASLTIIAIAWIAYRPLLGLGLLAGVIGIVFMVKRAGGSRRAG